jgi:hypothetical protein
MPQPYRSPAPDRSPLTSLPLSSPPWRWLSGRCRLACRHEFAVAVVAGSPSLPPFGPGRRPSGRGRPPDVAAVAVALRSWSPSLRSWSPSDRGRRGSWSPVGYAVSCCFRRTPVAVGTSLARHRLGASPCWPIDRGGPCMSTPSSSSACHVSARACSSVRGRLLSGTGWPLAVTCRPSGGNTVRRIFTCRALPRAAGRADKAGPRRLLTWHVDEYVNLSIKITNNRATCRMAIGIRLRLCGTAYNRVGSACAPRGPAAYDHVACDCARYGCDGVGAACGAASEGSSAARTRTHRRPVLRPSAHCRA